MATYKLKQPSLEDVEVFLKELHFKVSFQENVFFEDSRMKNRLALADLRELGYKSNDRIKFIQQLTAANYFKGPTEDKQNIPEQGDLWEFGMIISSSIKKKKKGIEYYIKVQLGTPDSNVICISFHPAEFKIIYPKLHSTKEGSL
ncbi:type II toxin-antitoxin system MqsR family toxin [Botryobacter ruber]|uniref:type II toxin-antitoxin system MqsR family toxin n=1 Tax=Botryobacter ruber TaxID=2171629 RepID=UPI000E0B1A68|nr:type II toxin-antitoxin system MqsR family toxin [Botryobacter ruber]